MNARSPALETQLGCEVCGSAEARELYTARDRLGNSVNEFIIGRCLKCGVLRTLPELADSELAQFYPTDYWGGDNEPSIQWIASSQSEKIEFLKRCGLTGGRILDVGCGSGLFLQALRESSWDGFGVEIAATAARAAGQALGGDRVFTGRLAEAAYQDAAFDVITFWSSLEHTNQPREHLIEARRLLRRGGTLIVQVPNAASYQARWFGGDWFSLDAPRHRYHFTIGTLGGLLVQTGFNPYYSTFKSKAHDSHSLRQSLKSKLCAQRSLGPGRILFLLSIPFLKSFDSVMSLIDEGATITLAGRAV
jgi:2-polyprenyl-3-methyl-5-hydroxy-6-metoxy-1,4-benzoquinol methylase